jgi:hypothetical protein
MNEIFSWNSGIIIKVIENTHAAIGYQIFHVGRGTINRFYWCFHGSEPTHKQGRKKTFSSWEQNLETKITCRPTEYFCAKSACA